MNMKNKTILVVATHSFVDLITNSSSELFICDTQKTIDAIKLILTKLIDTHSELSGDTHYSFSGCFGRIEEAKFTYDPDLFDQKVVDAYRSYDEYSSHSNDWGGPIRPQLHIDCVAAEEKLAAKHPYYTSLIGRKPHDTLTEEENVIHQNDWKDYLVKRDEVWTPYGAKKLQTVCNLFIEFLKVNKINDKSIEIVRELSKEIVEEHIAKKKGRYDHISNLGAKESFPKLLRSAFGFFMEAHAWGFVVHKGNILVHSASDNTIPYELFDLIESYLSASRYHLG